VTNWRAVHEENAPASIDVTPALIITDKIELEEKAFLNDIIVDGIVMEVNCTPIKAVSPIEVTLVGIVIDFIA